MKRISLEVISFIVSIMALLAAAQFSYSVYVGYCVIFEIFAFLFLLICLEIHQTRERWNTIGFDFHTHINVCFGVNDTNCQVLFHHVQMSQYVVMDESALTRKSKFSRGTATLGNRCVSICVGQMKA